MSETLGRLPNKIDVFAGQVLREVAKEKKITQENIGDGIGVTFQQVQKYMKGTNRMSLGALFGICEVLGISVSVFVKMVESKIKLENQSISAGDGI